MDFDGVLAIVTTLAKSCPSWVFTLAGWNKEASTDSSTSDITIKQFGTDPNHESTKESLANIHDIFQAQREAQRREAQREAQRVTNEGNGNTPQMEEDEEDDYVDFGKIDVDISAMQDIELETETQDPVLDEELAQAIKILEEDEITDTSSPKVASPRTQVPVTDEELAQAVKILEEDEITDTSSPKVASPRIGTPRTSIAHQHPFDLALPRKEQATPTIFLPQTPAIKSHARVTHFLAEKNASTPPASRSTLDFQQNSGTPRVLFSAQDIHSDDDLDDTPASESTPVQLRGSQLTPVPPLPADHTRRVPLPALDFHTPSGYDSDDAPAVKSSVVPLLPANLVSGWSPSRNDNSAGSEDSASDSEDSSAKPKPEPPKCIICKLVISSNKGGLQKAFATHVQRFHGQYMDVIDKDSQTVLGRCQRPDSDRDMRCYYSQCSVTSQSGRPLETHIGDKHAQTAKLRFVYIPFPESHPGPKAALLNAPKTKDVKKKPKVIASKPPKQPKGAIAHQESGKSSLTQIGHDGQRLVTTPVLSRYGLAYNTTYRLLICTSCGEGADVAMMHSHLDSTRGSRTHWDPGMERWSLASVVYENHPIGPAALPKRRGFKKQIVNSLILEGHVAAPEEIRGNQASSLSIWKNIPLPSFAGRVRPQVLGLRVFSRARKCKDCDYISPHMTTMIRHTGTKHGKFSQSDSMQVTAQTLSEVWKIYFEVAPGKAASPSGLEANDETLDLTNLDADGALKLLQQKKMPIMDSLDFGPDPNIKTVLPVYVVSGIDQFLRQFNRKTLRETYGPSPDDLRYFVLHSVILKSWKKKVARLPTLHSSILLTMTNSTPNVGKTRREFSPLTEKKSIAAYALVELRFIWALVRSYHLGTQHPNQIFLYNAPQKSALAALVTELDVFLESGDEDGEPEPEPEDSHTFVADALSRLLDVLYFPENYLTRKTTFDAPPVTFAALQCLTEDGAYTSIFLIPPILAKLQYSFRLHGAEKFWILILGQTSDDSFFEACKAICVKYLQDFNMSPFAKLRRLLHLTSVVARETPRPDLIWWEEEDLTVGTITVNIPKYKDFLQKKLRETQLFVEERILLGVITLQEIETKFHVSKLKVIPKEEDVVGNGILLDARNRSLDNREAAAVFAKMLNQKKLGMVADKANGVRFGREESAKWLVDIDKVMADLQPLCHTTEGPGVGRMTEDCLHSPTNTHNGSSNFVYEHELGTGGFRTGYHKGAFTSGKSKEILRLLPYPVFLLLWVMVHIIRPIEFTVLLDQFIKPENQQAATQAYTERIWASMGAPWTPVRLSNNIQSFMMRGMGVKMGARLYRHFAIAVQRHYPGTSYGRYDINSPDKILALAADLMAGHTTAAAEKNYATQKGVLGDKALWASYIRVSQDWHKLLGFETSFKSEGK